MNNYSSSLTYDEAHSSDEAYYLISKKNYEENKKKRKGTEGDIEELEFNRKNSTQNIHIPVMISHNFNVVDPLNDIRIKFLDQKSVSLKDMNELSTCVADHFNNISLNAPLLFKDIELGVCENEDLCRIFEWGDLHIKGLTIQDSTEFSKKVQTIETDKNIVSKLLEKKIGVKLSVKIEKS
jgi:hypothetical protein